MNLRLLQISDSALPIGGYTHSWGLEAALGRRLVHDAETLERWTRDWLQHALGPLEGVIVASVCRAVLADDWPTLSRANQVLTASLTPPSIRSSSREMGEQLLALASTWTWSSSGISASSDPFLPRWAGTMRWFSACSVPLRRNRRKQRWWRICTSRPWG